MNILHLLSNRKWTERSEPVADLVLAQQALGHDARLACGKWTKSENYDVSAEVQAARKGLKPIVLNLTKHFNWPAIKEDIPVLADMIDREKIDVLHAHMENAHLLASLARKRSSRNPPLVVSNYAMRGPKRGVRTSVLYRTSMDACTVISARARGKILSRYGLPHRKVTVIEPGIDVDRFNPERSISEPFQVNLPEAAQIMGMVTRIRADRRVDLAVSALSMLKDSNPNLYFLLVGHGEGENDIREQIQEAGLDNRVIWGGYCRDEQLVLAYRAMDMLIYPIPGTDQSCRTVREAQASGVPVLASRTGFLNHLVEESKTGLFSELDAKDLADTVSSLCAAPDRLAQLKHTARARAVERFSPELQATQHVDLYEKILAHR